MSSRPQVVNVDVNFSYELETRRIEAAGADFVLKKAKTEDAIIAACQDATLVLFENSDTYFTARVIAALPKCQAIVRYGVGVDTIDLTEATKRGIIVANSADYCTEEVSDHATALILAAALIGRMDSLVVTLVAAFVIGIVQSGLNAMASLSEFRNMTPFVFAIIVLLWFAWRGAVHGRMA